MGKKSGSPLLSSPHWKKNLRNWKKQLENLYVEHFLQLNSLICTLFAGFRNFNMQFAWDLKRGLECLSFICSCAIFAGCLELIFKVLWPWIPCLHLARSILEVASVLRRRYLQYFVVFPIYCLTYCNFRVYFRLVRFFRSVLSGEL